MSHLRYLKHPPEKLQGSFIFIFHKKIAFFHINLLVRDIPSLSLSLNQNPFFSRWIISTHLWLLSTTHFLLLPEESLSCTECHNAIIKGIYGQMMKKIGRHMVMLAHGYIQSYTNTLWWSQARPQNILCLLSAQFGSAQKLGWLNFLQEGEILPYCQLCRIFSLLGFSQMELWCISVFLLHYAISIINSCFPQVISCPNTVVAAYISNLAILDLLFILHLPYVLLIVTSEF